MTTRTKIRSIARCITTATIVLAAALNGHAQQKDPGSEAQAEPSIEPRAASILSRAMDHLANAEQSSTTAEVWQDLVQEDGTKLQFTKLVDIRLRRPDRLRIDVRTTVPKRSFYYNGSRSLSTIHRKSSTEPSKRLNTIDAMVEKVEAKLGVEFPLEDILISKPFGNGAESAKSGSYLGLDPVLARAATTSHSLRNQSAGKSGSRMAPCPHCARR